MRLRSTLLWTFILAGIAVVSAPAFAHGRRHVSVGIGWYAPWPFWGPCWGGCYGPVYLTDAAAVDTNIRPLEAEVWLDGDLLGEADRFNGFPRYLEVTPGEHRLEFRLEGYKTLRVDLTAHRGRLYRLDRALRPLESGARIEGVASPECEDDCPEI